MEGQCADLAAAPGHSAGEHGHGVDLVLKRGVRDESVTPRCTQKDRDTSVQQCTRP